MATTQRIQATIGPYAGQQIDVATDVAKAAIRDGWAVDPYAAASEPAKDFDHAKALAAATTAARQLRGEEEPAKTTAAKKPAQTAEAKTVEAEKPAETYRTRTASSPKDE